MKKLKFLFSAFVFILIALGCSQVSAIAPDKITDVEDLANFLNEFGGEVIAQGNTVTLQNDVNAKTSLCINTTEGNELTIDLNGFKLDFTFSSAPEVAAIWANDAGNFTITDSAKSGTSMVRTNKGNLIAYNTATLTIENTKLYALNSSVDLIFNNTGSSITNLKNVDIITYNNAILAQKNTKYNLEKVLFSMSSSSYAYVIQLIDESEVTLKNSEYVSLGGAGNLIWVNSDSAKAIINGGTYTYGKTSSPGFLLKIEKGALQIDDGIFESTYSSAVRILGGNVIINNGTFNGRENAVSAVANSTLTIKGGNFKANPEKANDDKGAIAFAGSRILADIIPDGYFITNDTITTNTTTQYSETEKEVSVYAKPDLIEFDKTELPYNGENQTPSVIVKDTNGDTLQYNTDYTVEYPTESKDIGEYTAIVTFIDKYAKMPSKERLYKIVKLDYDMSGVKFNNLTVTYDRKGHSIIATNLPDGVTAQYTNNGKINVGTYQVTANFVGDNIYHNSIPSKTATLTIKAKNIAKFNITGIKDKTYTGKAITQAIVLKDGNVTLKNGTDYTIGYSNNKKVGTATIVVTGKGNYTGKITRTFKINPKGTKLKKLTKGSKQFKVTWKAQKTQTSGYEIQYSTNKNFKSGNKKINIKNNKTTSKTVKKLKKNKKYYVRIRTYKTVSGKKYYSGWSKVLNVKAK